jgi:hypothetical protein
MPSGRSRDRLSRLAGGVALLLAGLACAAEPAGSASGWKFDLIRLRSGAVFRGLILEETPLAVRFQDIRQRPGKPTVPLFATTFTRAEIAAIERLTDAEREQLRAKLRELDPTGQAEKHRMERLELEPMDWGGKPGAGWRYRSDRFVLESDAPEEVVRRAAVRLEQIDAAYARYLPPRGAGGPPTTIVLFQSRAEYEARLRADGRQFVNLAFYDPAARRILCASDLEQLGQDLGRVRQQHHHLRCELDKQEAALKKLYRGKELTRLLQPISTTRQRIEVADRQNEGVFDQATQRLFAVLYHEAFHAYLAGFVYPPPRPEPPRWLNEGLAQIFETAVVEAGELRVGHADRDRLARAQAAARKGGLVRLARLLRSGPRDFLAAHAADRAAADASYLTSWALAFHLAFERRLLGSRALDDYLAALARGDDPEGAFAALVGQPLPAFEAAFLQYLLRLQPDGTAAGPLADK